MFSSSYYDAQAVFNLAAKNNGYSLKQYVLPNQYGPHNEVLSTDVAYHITPATKKLFIVNSGIHGIEGFYGSAMQAAWLAENNLKDLPDDLGIIFIHALNPYGFAHLERVDKSENDAFGIAKRIDPNRNFINFSQPLPNNAQYTQQFEDLLVPANWFGWEYYIATAILLLKFLRDKITHTFKHMIFPTMGGQYKSPAGFSYGGNHPCWANKTLYQILDNLTNFKALEEIVFIDLHTGVGKKGKIEAYSSVSEHELNHIRTKNLLNGIVKTISAPYPTSGPAVNAVLAYFADKTVTSFALECGTASPFFVLNALRAQNWFDKYGNSNQSLMPSIKSNMQKAFYPKSKTWRKRVTDVTMHIFANVIKNLTPADVVQNTKIDTKQRFKLFEPAVTLASTENNLVPQASAEQEAAAQLGR